jgi:hypothetical protein
MACALPELVGVKLRIPGAKSKKKKKLCLIPTLILLFFLPQPLPSIVYFIDQKSEVGMETGNLAGIMREEIAVIGAGITIIEAEIVIGTMTVKGDMIGSVTEIQIAPVVMIQEVAAGHGQGQWIAPGIMIATGIYSYDY